MDDSLKIREAPKGRKTKAKRERLELLTEFIADKLSEPIRVCTDTSNKGYKCLIYDRETNDFYISGTGAPGERWTNLEAALDAYDAFVPKVVKL
jgi:hypothetical protein